MARTVSNAFGPATPSPLRAAVSSPSATPALGDASRLSARPLRPLRDRLVKGLQLPRPVSDARVVATRKEAAMKPRKVAGAERPSPVAAVITRLTSTAVVTLTIGLGVVSQRQLAPTLAACGAPRPSSAAISDLRLFSSRSPKQTGRTDAVGPLVAAISAPRAI